MSESRYQRQLRGSGTSQAQVVRGQGRKESQEKVQLRLDGDEIDAKFGFNRMKDGPKRVGWLLNYLPITVPDEQGSERSGLDLYFLDRQGGNFKASVFHRPFFYVDVSDPKHLMEVSQHLLRRFEGCVVEQVDKEDLDMANHLAGKKHKFLKISFNTVADLMDCKSVLRPAVIQNSKREAEEDDDNDDEHASRRKHAASDPLEHIIDMREYDIPYSMRVSIDLELRVGAWFEVSPQVGSDSCDVVWLKDMLELCDLRVLAFDIECEKAPLKFPDASKDRIYMISYMIAGHGYLLINRDVVSQDVSDFEYTPLPKFPGPFTVINLPTEEAMLSKFIRHVQELRPHVFVTYNGDFFDWPFLDTRCKSVAGLSLYKELGIKSTSGGGKVGSESEYVGRCSVHLDAFAWVQRDSYLPQGNQGLKAVTKYKLGYDPIEVDPEDMLRLAQERPTHMASYSVSDAVATYYLYTTYVHNFIFSLCTIIPMGPEDVLRKGSGTLCEALLVVEACRNNIICPNKHEDPLESFYNGHLIQSETYIGGHVECLEAGVFRADIPAKFTLIPSALQQLIDNIDRDLTFALETEHDIQRTDVTNYDEVRQYIVERLEMLRDSPLRVEHPAIYHLDVGAMYPNIILTNRLQPSAMVSQHDCAACDFNREENMCKRPMIWTWRGDYSPATQTEYQGIKRQLAYEKGQNFAAQTEKKQAEIVAERLKAYSNRVYKKSKVTSIVDRVKTVCMRENPFYVNTVRAFRDRRYDYKLLTKTWKNKKNEADKKGDSLARKAAEDKEVLMDSLQLAHKCILNSFYGYVMRKGARWRSMEMAGIVTKTGAELIKQARELVEQVGRPLELDTDGIWCIIPSSFPQEVTFKTRLDGGKKKVSLGYPCAMLNADVHERYTNHQYQDLVTSGNNKASSKKYVSHSECSIYFELDGPYKAMVLPASPEEGKLLKKKYVVFNFDGTIAELKGFELKRRGELEIVKAFQSQVFSQFLCGSSLQDCYSAVGSIANRWLDVLDTAGAGLDDDELLQLISEKKTISKTLEDYGDRKATSLTSASRLADFLGAEMVKDRGLNCNLIISKYPIGAPVAERAIPVAIFSADESTRRTFLRKWMKEDRSEDWQDFRDVVDWNYYKSRLAGTIQKIVTIPAGMQKIPNPCPRVEHPSWVVRNYLQDTTSGLKQLKLTSLFAPSALGSSVAAAGAGAAKASKRPPLGDKAPLPPPKILSGSVISSPMKGGLAGLTPVSPGARTGNNAEDQNVSALLGSGASIMLSPAGKSIVKKAQATPESTSKRKRNLFGTPSSVGKGAAMADIDIEDLAGNGSHSKAGVPVVHFRMKSPAEQGFQALDFDDEGESKTQTHSTEGAALASKKDAPSAKGATVAAATTSPTSPATVLLCDQLETKQDFDTWLAARKESWKLRRQQKRNHLKALSRNSNASSTRSNAPRGEFFSEVEDSKNKKPVSVVDFVRNANLSASQGVWQILEIQATEGPGEFVVWAMTSRTQVQRFKVTVPRILYVHCRLGTKAEATAKGLLGGARVKRDLPHGKRQNPGSGLFEVRLSERGYIRNEQGLNTTLSDSHVEGVYESQTPLGFRAVLHLGCLARVAKASTHASYKLHDLEFVHQQAGHRYLEQSVASVRQIYVYTAQDKTRHNSGFAGLGIAILDGSSAHLDSHNSTGMNNAGLSGRGQMWLAKGGLERPALNRLCRKYSPSGELKFVPATSVDSIEEMYRACNEALLTYLREKHGPTVVIAQGVTDAVGFRRFIPALAEFPLTVVPYNSQDDMFPALQWRDFVAERMIQRFLIFPRWINDRLKCARHSSIPLCNLGADVCTTMIDVAFARQLQHNRHLLWASEGLHPDLGGSEGDEQFSWSDPLKEPVVDNQGVYRSICVELDVFGLPVAAIQHSSVLDAEGLTAVSVAADATASSLMEDVSAAANAANTALSFSTDASCARAFALLKAVAMKWKDEEQRGDEISDSICIALYRYLCGYGDGLLHDPLLHRLVYLLMSKLFKKLMTHLRKLGVTVIYASFTHLHIHTGKQEVGAAEEYVAYIVSTLQSHDLFSYLQFQPKAYWEQVIWLGPENWCGLPIRTGEEEEMDEDEVVEDHQDDVMMIEDTRAQNSSSSSAAARTHPFFTANATQKGTNGKGKKGKKGSYKRKVVSEEDLIHPEYDFLDHLLSPSKGKEIAVEEDNEDDDGDRSDADDDNDDRDHDHYRDVDDDWIVDDDEGHYRSSNTSRNNSSRLDNDAGERELHKSASRNVESPSEFPSFTQTVGNAAVSNNGLAITHNWNLTRHYPPAVASYFEEVVGQCIWVFRKRRQALCDARDALLEQEQTGGMITEDLNIPLDDEAIDAAVTATMRTWVKKKLTTDMLKVVDGLAQVFAHTTDSHSGAGPSELFPVLAGTHTHFTNPALEFVKATTHVLQMDTNITDDVCSLKRLLLTQLHTKEFAQEATFVNPSLSYVLRDVICGYCNTSRDIDLLRDITLCDPHEDKKTRWRCTHCGHGLNDVQAENRILDEVGKLTTAFVLQDFRCVRTNMVSTRFTATTSDLSMPLCMDLSQKSLRDQLQILHKVAVYHEFPLLVSMLDELMEKF